MVVKVLTLQYASPNTTLMRRGRVSHCPAGVKVVTRHSAFPAITPIRELGHCIPVWHRWKSRLPIWPLLVGGLPFFPWCLAGVGHFYLNTFCLAKLLFFWPFGYGDQTFLFCSFPLYQVTFPNPGYIKGNSGIQDCVTRWILKSLSWSFSFFLSPPIFVFIDNIQGCYLY